MIFDVPRINTTVRNSLVVTNSTVIYNTDNNRYEYYDGTRWKHFGEGEVFTFNTRTGDVTLLDSDIASLGDFTISGTVTVNNDIIFGSQALKLMTSSVDPNVSGVSANVGSIILKNDGTIWQKLDTGNSDWSTLNHGTFTNEPTGFPVGANGQIDHTSSSISFNDGTYTFSISPTSESYIVLIKGRQYRKTTTESITINPAIEGQHYFYFNSSGVLEEATSLTASTFLNNALIASIYWDTTNNKAILFGNERHGCTMDSHTQVRLHFERGAVYVSGMALNNFSIDGNANSEADITFSAASGELRDEDILHSLSSKETNAPIPIFYRDGINWRSITPSAVGGTYARAIGSAGTPGQIAYNHLSGGVWSRVNVSNNKFCCYHVIGTNDVNNPFVIVMGTTEYLNKQDAQTGAVTEISSLSGLPFIEMVFIGTVLFECKTGGSNSLKANIVGINGGNYVDWRFRTSLNPSTANVNTHNNLGGIYGASPYYHSNQPITTTDDVTFKSLTATNGISGSGTITLNNINYPNSDGTNGQVLSTNGSGTLTFSTITQNHNSLTGIQGGGGGNYYHSNQPINTTDSVQFGGLIVLGDLTVSGTTTTVNSTTLQIQDKNIELGKVSSPSDIFADGGGITLLGDSNKTFNWIDSTDSWTSSEHLDLANTKVYKIAGSTVLSATQVLGKNVPTGDIVGTSDIQSLSNKTLDGFTLNGDINSTLYAADFDLLDNVTSALSFDATGKSGILEIDTVNGSEKVKMSGGLDVIGTSNLKNISASGTLIFNGITFPVSDGSPNQVLKTDGAGNLSFGTITQDHNLLTNIQGGGGGNYYHSNQPINSTDAVTFRNLTVVSGVAATGTIRFNNITYPGADGVSGQVMITDGSGNLSFGTITQDHNLLTNIQGGGGGNYYHSNQPINTTDSVEFSNVKVSSALTLSDLSNIDGLTGDITSSIFTPASSTFSIDVSSATTFHGIGWIGGIPQGKILLIRNTSQTINIIFANQSVTETDSNARIITGTGSNFILPTNSSIFLFYDAASFRWKIIGQNKHNSFTDIQGGGGGNYYHSNQPINSTDNVTFNNLTVVSGVNVTGSVKLNNITYPTSDGTNGQVMTTDGNGNISFTTVAAGTAASGTILDTYINSKTVEINNNSTSNIQTIFSQAISGIYTFWVSTDPRIKGTFYFNENDPSNSILESISSSVSSKQDNNNTLNIYISSVNVIIQNKLGSNITLCIRRETTPLINPEPGNVSISNHNNLYGLQGGLTNTYYHSNQPINTTDSVIFNEVNSTGNITASGTISTTNSVSFGSISILITTTNATGTINDLSTANIGGYRFTSESALTITGFANGINGEILYLQNASSVNVTIKNSSSLSLASNRILTGNGSDFVLKPDRGATLQYDSFSLRWRILGGAGGNPSENPETLNFSNSPATIDFSQYATTSFRIKNPAQITLSNGTNGVWYTLAIVSDGNYSFTSETRFPLGNAQPVPSSGTVDLYTFHCIDTVSGTRYLATFAYDYSGVTLP